MPVVSSLTNLAGGRRFNTALGLVAYDDPGGKLSILISAMNALVSNVTIMQSALLSANVSAVSLSALSGVTFTTYPGVLSNWNPS